MAGHFKRITAVLITILFIGCKQKEPTLFTALDAEQTGIRFRNTLFEGEALNVFNYTYFYNGGGVAVGDINSDGLPDILFTGNMVRNRLFINKGNFTFEDITEKSGIAEKQGWCTGATMVDINGDGKLDIYICRSADVNSNMRKNLLFINNGDLTFTEKASDYGLADIGYSTQAAFFDYDKDGDLDCFIINDSQPFYSAGGAQENPALRNQRSPDFANKLYQNNNGHFTDVSLLAGITSNVFTFGLGLAVSDFNNDGWPDVYVSNDFNEPDYLLINNRNGSFSEQLAGSIDQTSLYSMGSDAADFNNDGLTDLVTLDMLPEDNHNQKMHSGAENFDKFQYLFNKGFYYQYSRNMLQKNNGDGTFSEIAQLAGISNTDWSWSALFGDFDNDGNKDLFITNGYVKDYTDMDFVKYTVDRTLQSKQVDKAEAVKEYVAKMPGNIVPNYAFQNNGNGGFIKRTNDWGLDQKTISSGAVYVDLDNDGDLDLVVNNTNDLAGIFRNNSEKMLQNHYLKIKLQGTPNNLSGIGSKIKLYSGSTQFYQEAYTVRGFQSSVDPILNFGVGKTKLIDSILIIWPDDHYQKLKQVKTDQLLTLQYTNATSKWIFDTISTAKDAYVSTKVLPRVQHTENPFNDFTIQSLLPNYLSKQGPCIVKSDVDKNGTEDIFVGGAKGQPSQLFLQNLDGSFTVKSQPAFIIDAGSEDVAAEFFDADGDGDEDLYVAAGGYEFTEQDPAFQDRLYINDGKGNFTKKIDALPSLLFSKGCVKAADIDQDGDIDLFVGGRLIPGKYPISPGSRLLFNDGKGHFTDATSLVAPALQQSGMITDAIWLDLNKDGLPDLIMVGEWAGIQVWLNQKGKLVDNSEKFIHFPSNGWWNKIYAEDMDGDGDIDLVLGNCGLNTQFHSNNKEPITLYYKDFDDNGFIDPVLCYFINGVAYPAASRDDLTEQIPSLKKKFLTYNEYANATIHDVFTDEQLKDAVQLKAETMETIYLENQGDKGFILHHLPIEAQYAPVYAITSIDINQDGKKDLLLAGNNTWTRIKYGRYSANHGVVLSGDGKGNFTYLPQSKSGLKLRGNVRSIIKVKNKIDEQIIVGLNDQPALSLHIKK